MTTTKPRVRNSSIKKTGIGKTPMGASETVKALMVYIDWTQWREEKTVVVTARKDILANAATIDTRTGEVVKETPLKMYQGITYYFVASSFEGWYYVGRVSGAGRASCDCAHYQCTKPKECKHQPLILSAHYEKVARENREVAAAFVDASAAIEEKAPVAEESDDLLDEDSKIEKWTGEELAIAPVVPAVRPYHDSMLCCTCYQVDGYNVQFSPVSGEVWCSCHKVDCEHLAAVHAAYPEALSDETRLYLHEFYLEGLSFEALKKLALEKGLSRCKGKAGYVWQLVQRFRNELMQAPLYEAQAV